MVDAENQTTRFEHDEDGLLRSVQDPRHALDTGADVQSYKSFFHYDAFHRMGRQSAPIWTGGPERGNLVWTGVRFDANDNLVTEIGAHEGREYTGTGATRTHSYDAMDRETLTTGPDRKVDPDGERTKIEYDEAGRVSRITEPKGVDSESVANDFTTVLEYDDLDRVIRRIQHNVEGGTLKESKRTHYCYEALTGDLKWLVAPKANLTSVSCAGTTAPRYAQKYTYDEAHQLLSRTDAGHGTGGATKHTTSRTYDANGNVRTATDERGTVTETKYNGRNLPIEKIDLLDKAAGRKVVTKIEYDDAGNRTKVISPRAVDAGSTTSFVTGMVYDKVNRPTRVDLPKSGTESPLFIHRRYDLNGNLAATSLPVTAQSGGDAALNLVDARNKTTYSHFDTGWVKTENQPGTPRVRFAYTPEGWQRSRVPETDAGVERWERQTTWEYWVDGMLRAKKERDGGAISYEYDANNQLTLAHDASGVDDSASDPLDVRVTYDGLGRQTEVRQQKVNADRWTTTRFTEYSLDDELVERIDNRRETTAGSVLDRGRRQRYEYDDAGWLVKQTDFGTKDAAESDAHADDRQITTDYFPTGWEQLRTIAKRPAGSPATAGFTAVKQRTSWDYFDNGKLKALRTRNGSDALLESHDVTYTDPQGQYVNGHRAKDVFTLRGPKASAQCRDAATPCTTQYVYDARDRLIEEKRTRGGSDKSTKYTLLPTGDVDVETRADGTTIDNDYVGQQLKKRTISIAGDSLIQKYNHNLDGDLECAWEAASAGEERTCASAESAGKLLEKYDYDPLDRVRKALRFKPRGAGKDDETTYKYDALDRVVEEDEKHGAAGTDEDRTTTFSYLGTTSDSVEEVLKYTHGAKSGQVRTKTFSYDAFGNRIGMSDKANAGAQEKEYTYGNDVHGSVSLLVDDAGQAKAQYGYTPYGEKDADLTEELDPGEGARPQRPRQAGEGRGPGQPVPLHPEALRLRLRDARHGRPAIRPVDRALPPAGLLRRRAREPGARHRSDQPEPVLAGRGQPRELRRDGRPHVPHRRRRRRGDRAAADDLAQLRRRLGFAGEHEQRRRRAAGRPGPCSRAASR